MEKETDWDAWLRDHPVFSLPNRISGPSGKASLELSLNSLPEFTTIDPVRDEPVPSGRRQTMVIKDSELIVAIGSEIRITALTDSKLGGTARKSYKILHTPNINFNIHQMALNPIGKLLAVAGAFQVAVIVLPRAGFTKLVPSTIDCKSVQVGQFYHAARTSAPIAKIDWHPWGDGGTTLMVMTTDGKLREYDISVDTEEPQQMLSFVPAKKKNTFFAEDESEREVASFTLGKGRADWGPLSVYAIMRSGDIYAICPYMPKNASIPSSYVHALECFVAAKQEYLSKSQGEGASTDGLANMYDYQHKYVTALLKQLPPGTVYPAISRSIRMHPPTTVKNSPVRQGPFLLQPSPRSLEGSEGGDATDIVYIAFQSDIEEGTEGETERLGVMLASFQDGRVDVYLDVEKVEARWEHKQRSDNDLPMLAVYETIDLGIVSMLSRMITFPSHPPVLDLTKGNHPVFLPDPIHEDTVYLYHAFGVHALQLGPLLRSLALALRDDADDEENKSLETSLVSCKGTDVQPLLSTFSVERRCSSPVVGVSVPNDVYLTYSIFILTSAMRVTVFPLNLRSETPYSVASESPLVPAKSPLKSPSPKPSSASSEPPAYICILGSEPFVPPPILAHPTGLPSNAKLSLPPPLSPSAEFMLTPDTLRYLGKTVERFSDQIHNVVLAHRQAEIRAELQKQEFARQREKCKEILDIIDQLKGPRQVAAEQKVERLQQAQKMLMMRSDRVLKSLMQKASPELSENETKWFEELRRMKEEVVGAGRYDDTALVARAKLLQKEVDRLLPQLKELKEKERARKAKLAQNREALGASQAFELGKRSNAERARIDNLEQEILKLASRLDMTLGRPPTPSS